MCVSCRNDNEICTSAYMKGHVCLCVCCVYMFVCVLCILCACVPVICPTTRVNKCDTIPLVSFMGAEKLSHWEAFTNLR